jgi:cytochrome c5
MKTKNQLRIAGCSLLLLLTITLPTMATANSVAGGDDSYPAYPVSKQTTDAQLAKKIRQGEYLVKLADCMACHTDTNSMGTPFAGGLKINTPFGALYTPNITPDKTTGIGSWTDDEFVRAMREGISPDGSYYFPVFPYNYFSKMSRDQILAIKAYLDSIPAVKKTNHAQEMDWPFNYRILQLGWRLLFFDFTDNGYTVDKKKPADWNRGAFIIEGPGHCALCHTELNLLGVPKSDYYLAGTFIENYYAPDITSRGLKNLNNQAVAHIFSADITPQNAPLSGPMADVEHNSLQYLTPSDALAVATYLKSINSESPPVEDISDETLDADAGRKLYLSNCKVCHSVSVIGAPEINDAAAWANLLNQGKDRLYEITIKGDGVMPPRGGCTQCSDARLKAAVDYMLETATGNKSKTSSH